jgi:hypothetical protein
MGVIRAIIIAVGIGLLGCAVPGCGGAQPFVFQGGAGAGRVDAIVYGQRVVIGIGVEIEKSGDEVVSCPVAAVTLASGIMLRGTYAGAPALCVSKYGVLGGAPAASFRERD